MLRKHLPRQGDEEERGGLGGGGEDKTRKDRRIGSGQTEERDSVIGVQGGPSVCLHFQPEEQYVP